MSDRPEIGPCCACLGVENVRTVVTLERRAPVPGTGWGCVVCHLPNDGAVAVLCDRCAAAGLKPDFVCVGYPKAGGRVPIASLPRDHFDHDPTVQH